MDPNSKVSPESLIPLIRAVLKKCLISSPPYGMLKRQLAECMFQTGKTTEGVMHLLESLGGKHKFDNLKLEAEWELTGGGDVMENIDVVKTFTSISCEYSSPDDFLADLNSLPKEWTLVQISRQPRVGNILQDVREHVQNGANFNLEESRLVVLSPEQAPLQVLLDKPLGSEDPDNPMKSFFDLISQALGIIFKPMNTKNDREDASNMIKDVSIGMADSWLREYQCLLPGRPQCPRLNQSIVNTIATISKLLPLTREMETFLCRMMSGSQLISDVQIESLVARHVTAYNESLTQQVMTRLLEFKKQHGAELLKTRRYPVLLLLEEELDALPWETTVPLRSSPVTRVHCFQFVMALYKWHGLQRGGDIKTNNGKKANNGIKKGYLQIPKVVHEKDTFVILNPSSDLPSLETHFKTFLVKKLGKWIGITGRGPSAAEFASGLSHPLFIYCGHGNGTLYLNTDKIGRTRVRSVTMLFGCRSVGRIHLGGRVPFSSVAHKYFVAGSPCIIGNLWNVSSTDCDRLAANLINLTFPSPPPSPHLLKLSDITNLWWDTPHSGESLTSDGRNSHFKSTQNPPPQPRVHCPDLALNVQSSRPGANYFLNAAALVVWGLPVCFE